MSMVNSFPNPNINRTKSIITKKSNPFGGLQNATAEFRVLGPVHVTVGVQRPLQAALPPSVHLMGPLAHKSKPWPFCLQRSASRAVTPLGAG